MQHPLNKDIVPRFAEFVKTERKKNIKFDLENAVNVLGTIADLLKIYTDFYVTECPTEEQLKAASQMDALAFACYFAERSQTYFSLIDTAADKISELMTQMKEATSDYPIIERNNVSENNIALNGVIEKYKHLDNDTQMFILIWLIGLAEQKGHDYGN